MRADPITSKLHYVYTLSHSAHLLLYVGCRFRRIVGENRAMMRETGVFYFETEYTV